MMEYRLKNIMLSLLLVLTALISATFVTDVASSVQTHQDTITSIDDKVDTVLQLTASATLASAVTSAIPDDTATPIAEKLAEFSEYFLGILCVLYAEKYLITILGIAIFRLAVPLACLLICLSIWLPDRGLGALGAKLGVLGLVLYFIIPCSVQMSDMVYNTYAASINDTIQSVENYNDHGSELTAAEGDRSVIQQFLDRVSETVTSLCSKASQILNRFIETLAVLIVTSCIIPILCVIFFLWLIKMFTGLEIALPVRPHTRSRHHHDNFVS